MLGVMNAAWGMKELKEASLSKGLYCVIHSTHLE